MCYENGTGVEKDEQKAVELYQSAIEQAHLSVQVKGSRHYYYGKMTGSNLDISFVTGLCQLTAKKGSVYAQYILGLYYENGIGVEADIKKALEFYERATEQGYSKAHSKVYTLYKNRLEVKEKVREKIELVKNMFNIEH